MAGYYPWNYLIPIIVLILIISGLFVYNTYYIHPQQSETQIVIPAATPSALSNIPHYCDSSVQSQCNYHWHVHLDIFVNSTSYVVIPNELGHINNQEYDLYAIHTHDYSGIIHLECCTPSEYQIFTLGDIFEVWGFPIFNSANCLTYHGLPVHVYVNGTLSAGNISSIQLTNHVEIAVTIGVSHPPIPSSYSFPPGF